MSGAGEERAARVRAVLAAAARIADPSDPLGREARGALPGVTGLSPANVELGLSRYVETRVTDADLARFVERAGDAPRVHVVLSANVFVGAVRAVALAAAASRTVMVRPSSREAVMAHLLRRAFDERAPAGARESAPAPFELCSRLETRSGDVIHVYGRRETIAAVTREAGPDVRVVGHGPGFGVAFVDAHRSDVRRAAERLSWDVVAFDQRGCLSPRIALVQGSIEHTRSFAEALALELDERERDVARGVLGEVERRDAILYRQTARAVGSCHAGASWLVGVDGSPRALVLPPSGRHVHVARVVDPGDVARLLGPFEGAVTTVGCDPAPPTFELPKGARPAVLGAMQAPALDGPVDLRAVL